MKDSSGTLLQDLEALLPHPTHISGLPSLSGCTFMVGLCTEALMYFMCNKAALVWFPQSSPNFYLLWVLVCSYLSSQSFVLAPCTSVRQGRGLGTDRKSGELKKGGGTELSALLAAFMATRRGVCVCGVCAHVSPSMPDIQLQGFPHITSCVCLHLCLTFSSRVFPTPLCVCVCVCVSVCVCLHPCLTFSSRVFPTPLQG